MTLQLSTTITKKPNQNQKLVFCKTETGFLPLEPQDLSNVEEEEEATCYDQIPSLLLCPYPYPYP